MHATVVAFVQEKGGCGKTMAAYNFAAGLARAGERVLVVDLDPQFPHPGLFGAKVPPDLPPLAKAVKGGHLADVILPTKYQNLWVTAGDDSMSEDALRNEPMRDTILQRALEPLRATYDRVVVDSPSALSLITYNVVMATDLLILPVDADRETVRSLIKTLKAVAVFLKFRPGIVLKDFYRILLSNYDEQRDATVNAWVLKQLEPHATNILQTKLHRTTALKQARTACLPIFALVEQYRVNAPAVLRAVEDFDSLTREVIAYAQPQRLVSVP